MREWIRFFQFLEKPISHVKQKNPTHQEILIFISIEKFHEQPMEQAKQRGLDHRQHVAIEKQVRKAAGHIIVDENGASRTKMPRSRSHLVVGDERRARTKQRTYDRFQRHSLRDYTRTVLSKPHWLTGIESLPRSTTSHLHGGSGLASGTGQAIQCWSRSSHV